MRHDIEWLIEMLERGRKIMAKLRDEAPAGGCHTIRAAICQIDAAKLIAKSIMKEKQNEERQ